MIIKSENQLQAAFWAWAWNTYPQFRKMMWAVPNGQARTVYERNLSKATGLLAGVWDLHCYPPGGPLSVIECKFGDNQLSPGQQDWGAIMKRNGAHCYVARTLDETKIIFKTIFGVI